MRRQPRLALIRVETFDKCNLVWCLSTQVVPLVGSVVAHAERGALPVRIDVARWDEVSLWIERAPVCDSERVVCDGVRDGTPHIDDPHTAFEQAICVCGDVEPHPGKSCLRCLVNVHAQLGDGAVSGSTPTVRRANNLPQAYAVASYSVVLP